MLKLHYFDLLSICLYIFYLPIAAARTTSCTTNPQKIDVMELKQQKTLATELS